MPVAPSRILWPLLIAALAAPAGGCRNADRPPPPAPANDPKSVSADSIQRRTVAPLDRDEGQGICGQILAAPYRSLPRTVAGNQFDPSGIAVVGDRIWLANDRECRETVPEGGGGLYTLDLDSGDVVHVALPGFDEESRKFEALAWDGRELHAIGNVGDRKANTFLLSIPLDPGTGEASGPARWHDLARGLGAATGLGRKPWDHGIKIEGLAALGPGELLIGLRSTGGGKALRGYRTTLSAAGVPPAPLELTPAPGLHATHLGTSSGGPNGRWRMGRELSGLADPAGEPPVVLGVASAEFEEGDDWAFLANALIAYWPAAEEGRRLCTFDDGFKAESVAFVPDPDPAADGPPTGTLLLLYDNDSEQPGGYRVVPDVVLPTCC